MPNRSVTILSILLLLMPVMADARETLEKIDVCRRNVEVIIDNRRTQLEEQPFIYKSRVYVPVRSLGNALGMDVDWNDKMNAVIIINPDNKFPLAECRPGDGEVFVYGEIIDIDYAAYTVTLDQHFDDNSIPITNPLEVKSDAVIIQQQLQEKNIHFYQLKPGCTGGFILDTGGAVRGIII